MDEVEKGMSLNISNQIDHVGCIVYLPFGAMELNLDALEEYPKTLVPLFNTMRTCPWADTITSTASRLRSEILSTILRFFLVLKADVL